MNNTRTMALRNQLLCALFAALIAVGAFLRIPVPVVPFTLQCLFTNLAGLLLGKRYGPIAVGVYIVLGLIGLPVFTGGGGIGYVLQPTFGYILGFAGGAWLGGLIVEKSKTRGFKTMLLAGLANLAVVYAAGVVYYYCIANFYLQSPIGIAALLWSGVVLCLPGDLTLCVLAALLSKRLYPLLHRTAV